MNREGIRFRSDSIRLAKLIESRHTAKVSQRNEKAATFPTGVFKDLISFKRLQLNIDIENTRKYDIKI